MIFLNLFYFFLLILFSFYIPGAVLLRLFKFSGKDLLINTVLSFSVGISFFMISIYLLSWLNLQFYYIIFLVLCLGFFTKSNAGNIRQPNFKNIIKLEYLIILIGSIFTSFLMWRSGSIENSSLVFFGVNTTDAIYHLSLIGSLKSNFPPTHPGLFEFPLKGYNFFYDLIVAYFSKYYRLEVLDLFFRFFPIFLSVFYGLSGWALGKFMKMQRESVLIFITLLYAAQSFLTFIFPNNPAYNSGIVQTIANIVDPSVILSISLLFSFYILIFSTRTKFSFVLSAIVLGVIPMIKIYTGFLAFLSIGIIFLIRLIRKKDIYYLPTFFLGGLVFAVIYFPINFGSGGLIFAPNLLYRHYLESISAAYNLTWYQKLLVFEEHDNYIKIILYKFILVLPLFYVPSLGLRILNLIHVGKLFDKNLYSENNLFWGFIILSSFLLPSFFIQSTAVFVIIQFLWIGYFILLIPTAYSLTTLFGKINTRKLSIIIGIIVLLSVPESLKLFNLYSQNPYKVDLNLYEMAQEITKIPDDKGVIVLNVDKSEEKYKPKYPVPIISAVSSHAVFFEPEFMDFGGIQDEIDSRKKLVGDLNESLEKCLDTLQITVELGEKTGEINSPYILDLNNTSCFDKLKNVELIYQKSNYSLYKVL